MNTAFIRLLKALREPASVVHLKEWEWDALLRHARQAGLLSRLSLYARDAGVFEALPEIVRRHMEAAERVAARQRQALNWEAYKLCQALEVLDVPVVLLKGAAYVIAELPAGRGRIQGDIDLLLPKEKLNQAETMLRYHGWSDMVNDPYDQRYYRETGHELPPMTHIQRGSTVDMHHAILPPTSRHKPDSRLLWNAITALRPGLYRLGDADLVIHAACHLYHEGEWGYCLRNLADIDSLLRQFGRVDEFWTQLLRRAESMNLARPMAYALTDASELLSTPVPAPALAWAQSQTGLHGRLLHILFRHGFAAAHADLASPGASIARFILYVRSHWLRMPLAQLLPHLLHQAWRQWRSPAKDNG